MNTQPVARSVSAAARPDLARLTTVPQSGGKAYPPGCEYVRGWGVFALPFDSGYVLALRVFPQNSFAPYRTVWLREPNGRWSIFVDGPRLDTACPRYYGNACAYTGYAAIDLAWTSPATLQVTMDGPGLEWTLTASTTRFLQLLNRVSPLLPSASWRLRAGVRLRELTARRLGLGELSFRGVMPSGQTGLLMPEQMYYINQSHATFEGKDLGRPVSLRTNPLIGEVPLPARGVFAIGGAVWNVLTPTSPDDGAQPH